MLLRIFTTRKDLGLSSYLAGHIDPKEYLSQLFPELKSKVHSQLFFQSLEEEIAARATASSPQRFVRMLFLLDHLADYMAHALTWIKLNIPAKRINQLIEGIQERLSQKSECILLRNYGQFIVAQILQKDASNQTQVNTYRLQLIQTLQRNLVNIILKKVEPLFLILQQRILTLISRMHAGVLVFLKKHLYQASQVNDKTFVSLYECYREFMQVTKQISHFVHIQKLVLEEDLQRSLEQRYVGINPTFSIIIGGSNDSTTPVSDAGTLNIENLI